MPNPPSSTADVPQHVRDRHELQLVVAHVQAVVALSMANLDRWFVPTATDHETPLTKEDILEAYRSASVHFNTLQGALTSGECDEAIGRVGLAGPEMKAKKNGFFTAVRRFFMTAADKMSDFVSRMHTSLRFGSTILGSVGAALEVELKKLPFAGAAVEAAKEFVEFLDNVAETQEADRKQKKEG
jgi:hypothetical protein